MTILSSSKRLGKQSVHFVQIMMQFYLKETFGTQKTNDTAMKRKICMPYLDSVLSKNHNMADLLPHWMRMKSSSVKSGNKSTPVCQLEETTLHGKKSNLDSTAVTPNW